MPRSKKSIAEPFHQGALDNFCGVLAVINAVQTILPAGDMLSASQAESLYKYLLLELSHRKRLTGVIIFGMSCKLVHELLALTADWIAARKAISIAYDRPFYRRRNIRAAEIAQAVPQKSSAIIRVISEEMNHWVVGTTFTKSGVLLIDSNVDRGIWTTQLALGSKPTKRRPIVISANDVIVVRTDR